MTEYSVVDEDRVNSIKNLNPNLIDFKLDDFTICAVCKYDFSKGEREPGLLLCRHSICIGCMQRQYNSQVDSQTLTVECGFDKITTGFNKVDISSLQGGGF